MVNDLQAPWVGEGPKEPKAVYTCDYCDCDICEGDDYYDINDWRICEACIDKFIKTAVKE